jgi:hypothetical protein
MIKIKNNTMGYNAGCCICGKEQPGRKKQPYIVYYKAANEKRGHNAVCCCKECAEEMAKKIAEKERTRQ